MNPNAWVRVMRSPLGGDLPWLVYCSLCKESRNVFETLALGPLGGTPDWRTAQDFAAAHALSHEATRCGSCLHVPGRPPEAALTKARA